MLKQLFLISFLTTITISQAMLDPHQRDKGNATMLMHVAYHGNTDHFYPLFTLSVKEKCLGYVDSNANSPLHYAAACLKANAPIIGSLCEHLDVDAGNSYRVTPLMLLIHNAGKLVNQKQFERYQDAIYINARCLIDNGASTLILDQYGDSAISLAQKLPAQDSLRQLVAEAHKKHMAMCSPDFFTKPYQLTFKGRTLIPIYQKQDSDNFPATQPDTSEDTNESQDDPIFDDEIPLKFKIILPLSPQQPQQQKRRMISCDVTNDTKRKKIVRSLFGKKE